MNKNVKNIYLIYYGREYAEAFNMYERVSILRDLFRRCIDGPNHSKNIHQPVVQTRPRVIHANDKNEGVG